MSRRFHATLWSGIAMACLSLTAGAQDRGRSRHDGPDRHEHFDSRYNHNRAYPTRGAYVRELPRERVIVYDRMRRPYYRYNGAWYAPRRSGFVVVGPPVGVFVNVLPPFYTTVWFGGVPYYYADDTYYLWRDREREYEVVDPPQGAASTASTIPAEQDSDVFVYPKNGQSSEQTARDRYECHRWAVNETGFDPTQSGGNVPEEQRAAKRADYRRAEGACLEGRGYTVK